MRRLAASFALLAVSLTAGAAPAAPRPPVVVALVVDQLGAWIADERWPLLPASGGFARLRREGSWAHALVYPYAVSDTAPGHAALFTGGTPRQSGIFGNDIVDDASGKRVGLLRDPSARLIDSDGVTDRPAASLAALRLPTLADALKAARPRATVIALSLKDRAALMGAGRTPTAALWFDVGLGRFVTSTGVARAFPAWAAPLAGADLLPRQLGRVWRPLDPAFVAAHAATPDAQAGEGDLGFGIQLPHALGAAREPARAFRATPFADEALLALALAAVDQRQPDEPMLLMLSLSANDYIGHVFGPDSWEAWDELARLDAALGRFFAALDAKLGRDGWSALLAADHGVTTLPEAAGAAGRPAPARPWCARSAPDRYQRPCGDAGRVLPDALAEELRAVARPFVGPADAHGGISGIADPYVYLSPAARALPTAERRRLDGALTAALRARPGVAAVFDAHAQPADCPAGDDVAALVCRSIPTGVPGELYVALRPGWFFDPDVVVGKGASHGSAYRFDRTVPLVVRAPGRVAAGVELQVPVGPDAYARTAAALLGVPPPVAARAGRDLTAR